MDDIHISIFIWLPSSDRKLAAPKARLKIDNSHPIQSSHKMEYTYVLVDPLDSSICTIEYTPCIKVKFHKSIMAANTAGIGQREGMLHINRPYVSKYCLPKVK